MKKRMTWLIMSGLVASLLALPVIATADTTNAIAETGGFSLALMGSGLTVDIALDDAGNIETVDVADVGSEPDPSPTASDAAASFDEDPHKFRFELADDGTRVDVKAKNHKLTSKVKAATLADLVGPHVWSGVLFPDATGGDAPTPVTFEISEANGQLLIHDVAVGLLPGDVDYVMDPSDDPGKAAITFTWQGFTKTLKIDVDVDDDDGDDEPSAVLKIELRGKDRQRLRQDLSSFIGVHSWNGRLCDGTQLNVIYNIGDNGQIGLPTVTIGGGEGPADQGYTIKEKEHGFDVRFDDSKARLKVKFSEKDDSLWELKVDSKTDTCKHKDDTGKNEKREDKKDKSKRDKASEGGSDTITDD